MATEELCDYLGCGKPRDAQCHAEDRTCTITPWLPWHTFVRPAASEGGPQTATSPQRLSAGNISAGGTADVKLDGRLTAEAVASEPKGEPQRDERCEHCGRSVEIQARRLMLEYYDADLYKRALEAHMKLCARPFFITKDGLRAASASQPEPTLLQMSRCGKCHCIPSRLCPCECHGDVGTETMPDSVKALLNQIIDERVTRGDLIGAAEKLRAFVETIESAASQPERAWISVQERLPQFGAEVLISYHHAKGVSVSLAEFSVDMGNTPQWGYISTRPAGYYWGVTHWMPLPDPPVEHKRGKP